MDSFGVGHWNEEPVHEICLDDFYIGKYEVTQKQWVIVMGNNPSSSKKGGDYPVEQVSWNDVQEFMSKLNLETGKNYRLPTEAEWEYAARSGVRKRNGLAPAKNQSFKDMHGFFLILRTLTLLVRRCLMDLVFMI